MLIAMQGIKEVRDTVHSTLLRDQKQKSWGGDNEGEGTANEKA